MIKSLAESIEFSTTASTRGRASMARPALIALAGYFGVCAVQAQGQIIYPVGFVWDRTADWTVRPPSDHNTTNGNPDDDQAGQPVWRYIYQGDHLAGGIGSALPWYTYPNSTLMVWDSNWFDLGVTGWAKSNDTLPGIFTPSTGPIHGSNFPYDVPAIRLDYTGACAAHVHVSGEFAVIWGGVNAPQNVAPIDIALVIRHPSGAVEPLMLTTVPRPPGTNSQVVPVNVAGVVLQPGDGLMYSARSPDFGSFSNWIYMPDALTITLDQNAPDISQHPQSQTACVADTATLSVASVGGAIVEPFTYEWRRDGIALINGPTGTGSVISGADESTLAISGCGFDDAGVYECVVTNACGIATSDTAVLTVIFDDVSPSVVHGSTPGQPVSSPHSGFIDARAESTDGLSHDMGLGSLTFVFDEPVYRAGRQVPDATSFVVTSTGGTPPGIASVDASANPVIRVVFSSPPPLREWTTVRAVVEDFCGNPIVNNGDMGSGALEPDRVDFLFLPGDVNQSRSVTPLDLVRFKQIINGLYVPPQGSSADYVDMNRSGGVSPLDLVRFKQLINGIAPATQVWAGATANHSQP